MPSIKNKSHKAKCQAYRSSHTEERNRAKKILKNQKRAAHIAQRREKLDNIARGLGFENHLVFQKAMKLEIKDAYAQTKKYDNYKQFVQNTGLRLSCTLRTGELKILC